MTAKEARKAMRWGLRQLGLRDWLARARLNWTDNTPEWVDQTGGSAGGGRLVSTHSHRSMRVWVGPLACKVDEGSDPLEVLFHELLHIAIKVAGFMDSHDFLEFFLNRQAECMAFAYRKGMKAWR